MLNQKNLILSLSFLFYLLPAALITGPFFSDLIITILAIFFLYISLKNKQWIYYNNFYTKFFLLFYIYLVISSIWADNTLYSLKSSIPYVRFLLFSLAIVYLSKVNKNFYNSFFKFTFLTLLFVIIDAYILFVFGKNLFNQEIYHIRDAYTLTSTARISGLFGDELILGSYISRLIFILIGLYIFCEKKYNHLFFLIFLISAFIIVFITGERLAFFILLFCILYIFTQISSYRSKFMIFLIVFFSIIFLLVSMNESLKNRMIISTFAFLENDKTRAYTNEENFVIFSPDHHEQYLAAYKMFLKKPILGHGHKMYKENCKNYKNRSVSSCSTHPHNIVLQIGVENGIIGLLFLFAIYLYLIKLFFYNLKRSRKYEKDKSVFYQICLLSIITANIFPLVPSGNFFNNWLSILYYLPVGFYLSVTMSKDNKYE
jgi:O-antigen ligase